MTEGRGCSNRACGCRPRRWQTDAVRVRGESALRMWRMADHLSVAGIAEAMGITHRQAQWALLASGKITHEMIAERYTRIIREHGARRSKW